MLTLLYVRVPCVCVCVCDCVCMCVCQTTIIALNECLEGPFDNSLKYYCQNTPIPPPPAPLYGQIVNCPSTPGWTYHTHTEAYLNH